MRAATPSMSGSVANSRTLTRMTPSLAGNGRRERIVASAPAAAAARLAASTLALTLSRLLRGLLRRLLRGLGEDERRHQERGGGNAKHERRHVRVLRTSSD